MKIVVDVPVSDTNLESDHVDQLKREGVPLRSYDLFNGVETGVFSWEDLDGVRRYEWRLDDKLEEVKLNPVSKFFKRKYRISRNENLWEIWYTVSEWNWYWPMWGEWSHMVGPDCTDVTKFKSAYEARRAIKFREERERPPVSTVIERL